jgi:hypothetical protein
MPLSLGAVSAVAVFVQDFFWFILVAGSVFCGLFLAAVRLFFKGMGA